MLSLVKRFYAPLLIAVYILVAFTGSYFLYTSPYTGMTFESCGSISCVYRVVNGSPAQRAGIIAGDRIMDVNGKGIGNLAFQFIPENISSKDVPLFWEYQKRLNEIVEKGKPLDLTIVRGEERIITSIIPESFPFHVILHNSLRNHSFHILFILITYLILRKMTNEITVVLFLISVLVSICDISSLVHSERNLVISYLPFKIFFFINMIWSTPSYLPVLHFALIFPRRKMLLERHAWIIKGIYISGIPVILTILINPSLLDYYAMLFFATAILLLLHSYFTEKDILYRRQIQWVIFGFSILFLLRLPLVIIPRAITGTPLMDGRNPLVMIAALVLPLSLAFAVTRHRLFEIEELFDYSVIYISTMVVLFGVELVFLRYVSPVFFKDLMTSPSLYTMPAVLLIVFVYIPIRNTIKRAVQKIFKRHDYSFQEELNRFVLTAGLCSEAPVLDRFKKFVSKLLGSKDITIIKTKDPEKIPLNPPFSKGEMLEKENNKFPPLEKGGQGGFDAVTENINAISAFLKTTRTSTFGYQLIDAGVFNNPALNTSLFIPVTAGEVVTHVIILHDKVSGKVYSRKDRHLLEAMAVNISHILEAEEIRRAKEDMAAEHKRDRDYVMKEMHDGLGSLLTNIAFTSHHANRLISEDTEKAKEAIGLISSYSTTASDFLRTGLTVLNSNEGGEGEIGVILSNIRHRLAVEIERCGMTVGIDMDKDIEKLKVGSRINLNILRSVQEAFCNILKHSEADKVDIRINKDRGFVNVEIKDNGKGFDPNQHNGNHETGSGLGLKNLKNRAEELGGYMKIHSSSGMGTTIMMSFPVEEKL